MAIRRTRGRPVAVPALSPAWRWLLLTGGLCPQRVPGWVTQAIEVPRDANGDYDYQPAGDVLWRQHRDELIAEARACGFEPFWLSKQEPSGAGFTEWYERFVVLRGY